MGEPGKVESNTTLDGQKDEVRKIFRIENAPNETQFQMRVDPMEVRFKYVVPNPAYSELRITNITSKRQCFKIKSTDNKLFKIQPTMGFLEPKQVCYIKITLNDTTTTPPENHHYFALFNVASSAKSVADAFKKGSSGDGVIRLHVAYEREGGANEGGGDTPKAGSL